MNIDIGSRMKDKEIDSSKVNKDNNTTIKKLPKSNYGVVKKEKKTKKKKEDKEKNEQSGSDNEEEKEFIPKKNKKKKKKNKTKGIFRVEVTNIDKNAAEKELIEFFKGFNCTRYHMCFDTGCRYFHNKF